MKKLRIVAYMSLLVLFSMPFWGAQRSYLPTNAYLFKINDTVPPDSVDSIPMPKARIDTVKRDTVAPPNAVLDAIVDYKSKDSIVMTQGNWGYLFGDAEVNYSEIKLSGEIISMNMDSSEVEAKYGLDSIGKEFGYPIFSDGGDDYETKTMKYNFKTKKGFSQHLVTEQGEGYVVAGRAKKNEDNSFFMREGKYTTCDQHDHPHFYLALTKAKVQPKKNVVTGPAYLVIEGLHIPFIGLPFGFFPFSDSYSSGVIMPSYGDEMDRGFNLHDGGYYFAINDYLDLKVLGTIYTKGSWALGGQSTYRKRYKHSGNVNVGYQVSKYGDKGLPDYSETKDMKINWSHSQDPKSNMFRTLSANVDFSTSSYDRNNLNTQYSSVSTQNTKGSSINLTQRFPNSPWSLNANASFNQTSRDKGITMTLPSLMVTMSRVSPFKRKNAVGSEKWYEKINISYTGDFRNSISTTESRLFKENLLKDWRNGMKHTIPVSATFSVFDYLNITPSVQYTERWYTTKTTQSLADGQWRDDERQTGFYRVSDFSASLGFQTKLYGFYQPLFAQSTTIRHVMTPSVSVSYAPDFGDSMWGYYETAYGLDANGLPVEKRYSPFQNNIFSAPGSGSQGTISMGLENNVEMKTPWESDSTGYKKISLIDNLGIRTSYNTQAEAFRWSNITTNLRLKLSKSLTVNLNATFDPYEYDVVYKDKFDMDDQSKWRLDRVDHLRMSRGGLPKLIQTSYSISPSINQDTFNKLFGGSSKKTEKPEEQEQEQTEESGREGNKRLLGGDQKAEGEYDSDGYIKNEVKWSLGVSFSMNYALDRSRPDFDKNEFKMKLTNSLSFNGSIQPTKNWSFTFNGSYDFDAKKIPHMQLSLTRDLHCWSISGSVTPVGPYKSYYVSLRANSSMLQDLKHEFKGRASSNDPKWD